MLLRALLPLTLLACGGEDVGVITGTVLVGPGEDGAPLVDGTVTILGDDTEFFDEATTDRDGRFEATAPNGLNIFAIIDGPQMVPSVFTGNMGQGTFVVEPGILFGWPEADRTAMDTALEGCSQPGPVITGEVRLFGATDDSGESPVLQTAFAYVETPTGERIDACYFNDDGTDWDEGAIHAGPHGQYAIYGVEPGFHTLVYGYLLDGADPESEVDHVIAVYVTEDAVAPQYPAWAQLVGI
jgi:hypothetical protein